jgi:hypothetical protein
MLPTFLLVIAEAISNGFFTHLHAPRESTPRPGLAGLRCHASEEVAANGGVHGCFLLPKQREWESMQAADEPSGFGVRGGLRILQQVP